jgi:tripartite-type tricarboxylate transporter receptor subunit TctC
LGRRDPHRQNHRGAIGDNAKPVPFSNDHFPFCASARISPRSPDASIMRRAVAAFAALVATSVPGATQDWPNRPITMVIPLAAGGGSDGLIRVFTPRLGELLGQQVIVENAGGAGGMIGAARVAKAPADGYQVLLGTFRHSGAQPEHLRETALQRSDRFHPRRLDIRSAASADHPKGLPGRQPAGIHRLCPGQPGDAAVRLIVGAGGTGHLACALLNSAIGVNVTHVPYRGGGPAMQDLIAGRIDYQCALANIAKPQIEALQAKPIALLSVDRSPTLPDVATAHEQGLIDFEAAAWNGIFLPKETPPRSSRNFMAPSPQRSRRRRWRNG